MCNRNALHTIRYVCIIGVEYVLCALDDRYAHTPINPKEFELDD